MNSRRRQLFIWLLIGSLIIGLSQCTDSGSQTIKEGDFAAKETCVRCHKDLSDTYALSAHSHTSAAASDINLEDLLDNGSFKFKDSLTVKIEQRKGGFFQVAYSGDKELQAQRFDVVFGSGEKARTFGYWGEGGLFQLPLTHYSKVKRWVNSPGFATDLPDFNRAIISGCLECHSSFAKTRTVKSGSLAVTQQVVEGSIAYGIDCQRCHGPAAKHVAYHEENPGTKAARFLVKISQLSRQQKIDNCAVCHSGSDQETQRSTFAFQPGDTLSNFYYPYANNTVEPDVHGNQYQMLAASACFIKSNMDCSSCHNTHQPEKNNPVLYAQRCANCHSNPQHPSLSEKELISTNCIDCHMPVLPSRLISFQESGQLKKAPYLLRSHKIAIYPSETKKIYSYLKSL